MNYFITITLSFLYLIKVVNSNKLEIINCNDCKIEFLKQRLSYIKGYSTTIYVPVTIGNSKVRIAISSENFHRYLTGLYAKNDSSYRNDYLMDTLEYYKRALTFLTGKDTLKFNPQFFDLYMGNSNYTILDNPNPYEVEIKKHGIAAFIKKRLVIQKNMSDRVIYKLNLQVGDYDNYDNYRLTYLYEALFNNNIGYGGGDGDIIFVERVCK